MILPVVRRLSPSLLLVCLVLPGCSVLKTDADPRGSAVFEVADGAWFERCIAEDARLATDQRPLLVAVLSPRMPYSLLEWPRMQREAEHLGFRAQVWRDAQTPDAEWAAAMASAPMQRWQALKPYSPPGECLTAFSEINHFPYVRVLIGRRMHAWPLWGVMPDQAWRAALINRLSTLGTTELPAP